MRDDGVLYICDLVNVADNGDMPHEILNRVSKHWFDLRTIGVGRAYLAKGVNEQIDMLVRIDLNPNIRIGQYAVLGNGDQYRITNVTSGEEVFERTKQVSSLYYRQPKIVGLKYTEITLERLDHNYDVSIT